MVSIPGLQKTFDALRQGWVGQMSFAQSGFWPKDVEPFFPPKNKNKKIDLKYFKD